MVHKNISEARKNISGIMFIWKKNNTFFCKTFVTGPKFSKRKQLSH